jgi:UDP-N-acetylglucosamine 2-epimerase (non-hydrolysing)
MTLRVMSIYGTRPEAIKLAPVVKALEVRPGIRSYTVVTGQHREMLDQVNRVFGVTPDHDLDVFGKGQSLNRLMAKVFDGLEDILSTVRPDVVVVQGDTTTVTAAAIAAFNHGIRVAHVEAGLRSGDLQSPFPEEANRKLASQVTSLHLAPTSSARDNLLLENVDPSTIVVTGNTVIDALHLALQAPVAWTSREVARVDAAGRRVLLVTTHRRENWGEAMSGFGRALRRVADDYPDLDIIIPTHRNQVVRDALWPHVEGTPNIVLTEPMDYGEFVHLLNRSWAVLTDSGGIQEEAPALGKPVLVMRDNTERPEAVAAGVCRLIGTDEGRVEAEVRRLLTDPQHYAGMARGVSPYGDGLASARIVAAIETLFGRGERLAEFQPQDASGAT